ncbi:OmpA family protein [Algoriphagus aestuariicola]|uniref:OmpA family protein n=2 Tax=Algoriphagus aestuariicola TaxID=1852016 RepID=A0ABS3BQX1_9BACT|nr:OmpA family protein [Algoriphagus aestuariicola]
MVLIMRKTVAIFGIVATVILGAAGQVVAQKSAVRYADQQMDLRNYKHALDIYEKAFDKKPVYETAKKIAETQDILRDYDGSYNWWETTVSYEEADKSDYAHYLRSAQLNDRWEEAVQVLSEKGVNADSVPGVPDLLTLKSKRKVKLEPAEGLNSVGSDFVVSKDSSGNSYFVSDRGGVYSRDMPGLRIDGRNQYFSEEKSDFTDREYFKIYRQDTSGMITEVISNVPNTYNFSDPTFDKRQGVMFYSVTRGIKKVKKHDRITVQPEIYYSKLNEAGELEGFTPVPFNDSISYAVMNPFADEEAGRLYFTSDMPGGMGGTDLYYVSYDQSMSFGMPVNLGPEINTSGNESHAFRKGDKFYFSSTGHSGVGGMDVFQADYSATHFGNVQNMGIPVNSTGDDFAYRITEDGSGKNETYLSSNRKGGMGLDDIYMIQDVYRQFIARVIDCEGIPITDAYMATLRDHANNGNVTTNRTARGSLHAELEPDSDFGITISKPGYFSIADETITTKGFEGDTLRRVYKLVAIPYQLPVYVDIVYYDLDKYQIREDAKPALDKLGEIMNKYPFLDLIVASYTDSRASDAYNITLSNNRAQAVTDYMAQYNIAPGRVRLEWFGEQGLVNDCGDGVPCPELDHQLNRRSELILEAFPDRDVQYEIPESYRAEDFCDTEALFEKIQNELAALPTIYFDFGKSMLRSVYRKELERTAVMLKRLPNLMLTIEGHTDQRGTEDFNQRLSERRAAVVKEYLNQRGIENNRMEEIWFGKSRPIHDCKDLDCTEAMHQLNRRTELRLGRKPYTSIGDQQQ